MIISQTPLRISFFGGGTDLKNFYNFNIGKVLSTSIDKYIYVIIKERYDDLIVLNYSKKEIVDKAPSIQHELIREAIIRTGIKKGVEITTLSDIPSEGSGLGSSSSLLVGLLNAFYTYMGGSKDNLSLAKEACEIEINILKKPIGKQDQYAASFGGLKMYEFLPNEAVNVIGLNIGLKEILDFQRHLYLVYTGITRKSSSILEQQSNHCDDNKDLLKTMSELTLVAKNYLENNKFDEFGQCLNETWEIKKRLAKGITCPAIDEIYQKGIHAGALGGKLLGAGGGGFLLFYIPDHALNIFKDCFVGSYKSLPFKFTREGTKIIFNNGRNEHMI